MTNTMILYTILVLLLFFILSIFVPSVGTIESLVNTILTVTSILFGLLVGFFISVLWSRFSRLRTASSVWSSNLVNLLILMESFFKDKKFKKEFVSKFDKYIKSAIEASFEKTEKTDKAFRDIFYAMKNVKMKNNKEKLIFDKSINLYNYASQAREEMIFVGKEKLFVVEWFILISLSSLIIISLFLLKTNTIISTIMTTLFPTIVILAVLIVYNLNEMKWSRSLLDTEPEDRVRIVWEKIKTSK